MNPVDWEDSSRRWQTDMNAHQKPDRGRFGDSSGTPGSHTYSQYTGDTGEDPPDGPAGRRPPRHHARMEKAGLLGPVGRPFDPDRDGQDWMRKLRELREVEEERAHGRKVAVARKTALEPSPAAHGEQSDGGDGPTLQDRVNAILQQRRSDNFLSKASDRRPPSTTDTFPPSKLPFAVMV